MALPGYKGKAVKLYYITQVKTEPPVFVIFTNYPSAFTDAYIRHIEKCLREKFSFKGTPIRIYVRARKRGEQYGKITTPLPPSLKGRSRREG
jgi:GTP-binding protein